MRGERDVRPHRLAGVAQPLGVDVAGRNIGRTVSLSERVPLDRLVVCRQVEDVELRVERGAVGEAFTGARGNGHAGDRQRQHERKKTAAANSQQLIIRIGTFPRYHNPGT